MDPQIVVGLLVDSEGFRSDYMFDGRNLKRTYLDPGAGGVS